MNPLAKIAEELDGIAHTLNTSLLDGVIARLHALDAAPPPPAPPTDDERMRVFGEELDEYHAASYYRVDRSLLATRNNVLTLYAAALQGQADATDAARWRHIEMLWMLGDVELTTDDDAQFILCSNPAEHKSEAFTAIDPAATVDAGIAALAARGAK